MSSSLAFVIVIIAAAEGGGHFQGMHLNPHPGNLEKKKTQWKDNNIENIIFKFHIILCQQFKVLPQFPLFNYSVIYLRQSLHRNKQANLVCQWTLLGIIWLVI